MTVRVVPAAFVAQVASVSLFPPSLKVVRHWANVRPVRPGANRGSSEVTTMLSDTPTAVCAVTFKVKTLSLTWFPACAVTAPADTEAAPIRHRRVVNCMLY